MLRYRRHHPLVALAAGSLLGGTVFHMLPAALAAVGRSEHLWGAFVLGFASFMVLEHAVHWHHCHRAATDCRKPLTYLILLGDALHNFIGGLAIASTFMIDIGSASRHGLRPPRTKFLRN